jgi:hypothetical protein
VFSAILSINSYGNAVLLSLIFYEHPEKYIFEHS